MNATRPLPDLDRPDLDLLTEAMLADLTPLAPPAALRERLLRSTSGPGRLARFADQLAGLIDVAVERARELLERALDPSEWEPLPIPGATTLWVEGGPRAAACIRGFVRIPAGAAFPHHTHAGDEQVLVLEGCMVDDTSGREFHPGEVSSMAAGSSHEYHALAGATDLL
ncbi:MAG TPA: cupin domain-containing protein, partial [Myxococcota bacterium]|nr:cupin domain-containing protein [Myxococcota bacterium]